MKIVFLENVIDFGGARKSTIELAKNLSSKHEPYIVDVHGTCNPFIEACNESGVRLEILLKRESQIIMTDSSNIFSRLFKYIRFFFVTLKARRKLSLFFRKIHPDYVIVNNTKVLPLLLRNKYGSKVILFARGWFMPQQINRRDRCLYRLLVDRYCCVSEATRYALVASGIATLSNTFVVHNSINLQNLKNVRPAAVEVGINDTIILVSGGFLPSKGIHVAVEVARKLKERAFSFRMIITGVVYDYSGSRVYYEKVLKMIDDYGLDRNIQLEIGRSSVLEFFKISDIFIHPSDTEGLPRVIMEAMAFHVPVIANAVGGVTDYILDGYTGILTRYNNVDDYVDSIIRISTDTFFKELITDNAYQLVSTCFQPSQQVEALERALQ